MIRRYMWLITLAVVVMVALADVPIGMKAPIIAGILFWRLRRFARAFGLFSSRGTP